MLVKTDVLILNGQKLVQGMQVHKQLMFQIPQVVGSVVVLLELAAIVLRQAWYI